MKRLLMFVVVLSMLVAAAGCAPAATPTAEPPKAPAAAEPTQAPAAVEPAKDAAEGEITITHWQHQHEARTPVIEEMGKTFSSANAGIKVSPEAIPYDNYFDKLITSLSSGTGPDVFQVPMEMAEQLIASQTIAPVPDSVLTTEQIDKSFVPWTVERFKADGKYYGLPTDTQTLVLFVNTDLLKECGGDPAAPPKTWEDLLTQAQKCTMRDGTSKITQAGLDTRYRWAVFTQAMYSYMDDPVVDAASCKANYDNEQGLAAWKMVSDLMVGPNAVDSPEFLTGQRKFEQGKAVFYINHPVTRGRLEKEAKDINWIAVPAPVPAGKNDVVAGHSWAYVVNAKSKNPEAAWKWVQYLTNKENQIRWNQVAGDLPSLVELLNDPSLVKDENAKVMLTSMASARPVQQVGQTEVDTIQTEMWEKIVIQKDPYETAVKDAAKAETEVIKSILGCK